MLNLGNVNKAFDFEAKKVGMILDLVARTVETARSIRDVETARRLLTRTIPHLKSLSSLPVEGARSEKMRSLFNQAAAIKGSIIRAETSQFIDGIRTARC